MLARCAGVCLVVVVASVHSIQGAERRLLQYAPTPADNPLKGLVPYQGDVRNRFPHSLEFNYLPYAALVQGYHEFDWGPLEAILDDIASRGHQAIFRIFLEYPSRKGSIPPFLLADGLRVTRWDDHETPDYEDANLRRSLRSFVAAMGRRYDGDPRIGFITAGLLGTWGEWHNHPRSELFASQAVQREVLDAYEAAFKTTPVLLRYPAGGQHPSLVANADRNFGYHDDSFAWATLHTGRKRDAWFFMTALRAAGKDAENAWQTRPIGGEIRPEAWGQVFDEQPGLPEIQSFRACVEATHASWLMDSGMFREGQPLERVQRAEAEVRRMGYEFHATAVTIGAVADGKLSVCVEVENRGVAPFYYDWRVEWGLLQGDRAVKTFPASGKLTGLLPGAAPRAWSDQLDVSGVEGGVYQLAVRAANPLPNGKPVRFANTCQDADLAGWLSLGEVETP